MMQPNDALDENRQYSRRLAAFVGKNADYYLAKWEPRLRSDAGGTGFNWAAFFFSGFWLAYRKMYRVALIFYALVILETVIEDAIFIGVMGKTETPSGFSSIAGLAAAVICGAYGNRWYLSHARVAVAENLEEHLTEDASLETLSARGGTSLAAAIGVSVLAMAVGGVVLVAVGFLLYNG